MGSQSNPYQRDELGPYFSAGHSLFHFHISYDDFLSSLYANLLFNPLPLNFMSHFFYSPYMEREVLLDGVLNSWVRSGLEAGLINVHVNTDFKNFQNLLDRSNEEGARGIARHSAELAKQYDGLSIQHFHMMKGDSLEAFDERLRIVLHSDWTGFIGGATTEEGSDLEDFWTSDIVKRLRFEAYKRAKSITGNIGVPGMRLAAYIRAAREITTGGVGDNSDSVEQLCADLRASPSTASLAPHTYRFFKIVCDTFNVATAQWIGAQPNSAKGDQDFLKLQELGEERPYLSGETFEFSENIRLPSIAKLRSAKGDTLLKCREYGYEYFDRFSEWTRRPDEETTGQLLESLVHYSEVIRSHVEIDEKDDSYRATLISPKELPSQPFRHAIAIGSSFLVGLLTGEPIVALGAAFGGELNSFIITARLESYLNRRELRRRVNLDATRFGDITMSY